MFCIDCCFQSVTNRGDEKVWLVSDEEVQDFYWPGLICELRDWLPGPHGINTVCLKFEKESQLSPEENQQSQRKVNVLFDFQYPIISDHLNLDKNWTILRNSFPIAVSNLLLFKLIRTNL